MANYTKTTNFTSKDSLPSGDPNKVIRGSEFDAEFNNIETAINSKFDAANVSSFGSSLIDDADAVTARNTLQIPHEITDFSTKPTVTSGTSSAYTASVGETSLEVGRIYNVVVHATNSSPCTLDLDGLGAKSIKLLNGDDIPSGFLVQNSSIKVRYDGTNFILVQPFYDPSVKINLLRRNFEISAIQGGQKLEFTPPNIIRDFALEKLFNKYALFVGNGNQIYPVEIRSIFSSSWINIAGTINASSDNANKVVFFKQGNQFIISWNSGTNYGITRTNYDGTGHTGITSGLSTKTTTSIDEDGTTCAVGAINNEYTISTDSLNWTKYTGPFPNTNYSCNIAYSKSLNKWFNFSYYFDGANTNYYIYSSTNLTTWSLDYNLSVSGDFSGPFPEFVETLSYIIIFFGPSYIYANKSNTSSWTRELFSNSQSISSGNFSVSRATTLEDIPICSSSSVNGILCTTNITDVNSWKWIACLPPRPSVVTRDKNYNRILISDSINYTSYMSQELV